MKATHAFAKTLALVALIVAVGATAATWNAARVSAFNPQPDPPAFAYVGIVFSQTARLSVVTDSEVQPGSCRQVELQFVDAAGHTLAQTIQPLRPGRGVFLDLNHEDIRGVENPTRVEVRGMVSCPADPSSQGDGSGRKMPPLAADVQVIDNVTGKTEAVVPSVQGVIPSVQR